MRLQSISFIRVAFLAIMVAGCLSANRTKEIIWSDGDSGKIDGTKFRLSNIDAPETNGVGAAIGGAKCELERELGFNAKAYSVEVTRGDDWKITREYGLDPHGRMVVDLSVDGMDLGTAGLEAGYFRPWPHINGKAQTKKPDWCYVQPTD